MVYFLAELGVYVAVVWWSLGRDLPLPARLALAAGGLVVFAGSWGLLAAPHAAHALSGVADVAFRSVWFGAGLAAAVAVVAGATAH